MTEVSNAGPDKKPFLKRGEGTTRRVYAFKYKDEAKKKREDNQRAALERAAVRRSHDVITAPDLGALVSDNLTATINTEPTLGKSVLDPKIDQPSSLNVTDEVEDFGMKMEKRQERRKTGVGLVDGSCRVETQGDEGLCVEDAVVNLETKGERQEAWLESQRRHEEAQWEEAMELREFESLERRIVEETRSKLEKAEDSFKKKHVTFQDIPQEATPLPHPEGTKVTRGHSVVCPREIPKPKDRFQNRESVQRVKSLRMKRQEKLRDPAQTPAGEGVEKRGIGRRLTPKSQSSEAQTPSPLGIKFGQREGEKTVVDSSLLDRLIEKDFYEVCQPTDLKQREQEDSNYQEELRLQSMREEFEREKKEWQRKQESAMTQFEATKAEEMKKIKRERRVLEQQSKALLKLPNKKERSEIESLEALLETERKESRSKEARHKLTVERLRDHIQQLQVENKELREEVKWYEEMQLKGGTQKRECRSVMTSPPPAFDIGTQMDAGDVNISLNECSSYQDIGIGDKWALRLENPFYSETSTQESLSKSDPAPIMKDRPSGREGFSISDQMPGWTSEPLTHSQIPVAPLTFPDATCPTLQHVGQLPNFGGRIGGNFGSDGRYGANAVETGFGLGCPFGGQQMSWIPNYTHSGYFPLSIARPTMPCQPMSSYSCQLMPALSADNIFG